ncbi:MAG: trypsin-like serine protease [Deltaproteobacteria bacterium]|nr:trypsin-like serine protease [Deltaproteobacteria bacterium]MBW2257309.1 trypsin-like serine protease [Deltaproteobacteria bacterium]
MLQWILPVTALLLAGPALASGQGSYKVVGGAQAALGAWPDAAGVVFGGDEVGCTGVLVAPDVVLTAGHCTEGVSVTHVILDTNDWYRTEGEVVRVQRAVAHPQWWSSYDIAVLVLQDDAETVPRAIAQGCVLDDYLADSAPVAIVGYGAIDVWGNQYTTELREAFTTVVDHDCTEINTGCEPNVSPGGEIGAGGGGIDACFGDSGGPLYLITEVGDYLVGTTSRGFTTGDKPCEDGGIYIRPDAVVDWIESVVGHDIPVPTCNFPPDLQPDVWKVSRGKTSTKRFNADDPDGDDGHTWALVEQALQGEVVVHEDGSIDYIAGPEYLGLDEFVVTVTDSGYPAHTVEATVPVEVVKRACGCATPAVPASGWLAGLLALLALRRRRPSAAVLE